MSTYGLKTYWLDVGFDGEGYSRRTIPIKAYTEEQAKRKALAWYTDKCSAHLIGPNGKSTRPKR